MRPIPWQLRFVFDLTIYAIPIWTIATYPRVGMSFLNNRRRKYRRRNFEEVKYREDSALSSEEVIQLRRNMGFEDLV